MDLGATFKQLRTSRHITLKEACKDDFSPSMLSRFESGQNDLSADKFLTALEHIHTDVNEFLYLAHGFIPSAFAALLEAIFNLETQMDVAGLRALYEREAALSSREHAVNALVIKAHLKALDDGVTMTEKESRFLHDYLFETEIWGRYELELFAISTPLLSVELFSRYTREILRKTDTLGDLPENRAIIHTMLLNGFLLSIDEEDFDNATYFDQQIKKRFYHEKEAYFRIVYLFAQGLLTYKKGDKVNGTRQMQKASSILETLDCQKAASYYQRSLDLLLQADN